MVTDEREAMTVGWVQASIDRSCIQHTYQLLAPYIQPTSRILDIGCGSGMLAHVLEHQLGFTSVFNVDVEDLRQFPLRHHQVCDCTALPFDGSSFDVTILTFVLHHIPDAGKLAVLREAIRVTRGHLFILEDTPDNFLDDVINWVHGWSWQLKRGTRAGFGFYTFAQWRALFAELGLRVVEAARLGRLERMALPNRRSRFVLEVPAQGAPQGEVGRAR